MKADYDWLESWVDRLKQKLVLELGAGEGIDSTYLRRNGCTLVATDLKPDKELEISYLNHGKPLPFVENTFQVVVASLTLHYFKWSQTVEIINEISRVLKSGGLLVCRVKSVNDEHYGATGYPELEPRLYSVKGQLKRFFTKEDIIELLGKNWNLVSIEEKRIDRYKYPKIVWEFGAINSWQFKASD